MIPTAATNPKVTQTGDYIFRVCFTDDFQAVVIARFVLEKLHMKKVAFMTDVKQAPQRRVDLKSPTITAPRMVQRLSKSRATVPVTRIFSRVQLNRH